MSDLIDRQAAIDALDECYCGGEDSCGEPWIYKENAVEAINMIEPLPSAQQKTGKWMPDTMCYYEERFICSECKGNYKVDTCMGKPTWNYCPNCGARMMEVTE